MNIIYTTQTSDFKEGFAYRNPRYFAAVEPGAERVLVVGDWPAVVAAYEKAGVEVDCTVDRLRDDGPTVSEYVDAGYQAANYPPNGYASRSTPDEIAVAIGMQAEAASKLKDPTVAEIKEALAAKGVEIPEGVTKKADLQALLDAAAEPDKGAE